MKNCFGFPVILWKPILWSCERWYHSDQIQKWLRFNQIRNSFETLFAISKKDIKTKFLFYLKFKFEIVFKAKNWANLKRLLSRLYLRTTLGTSDFWSRTGDWLESSSPSPSTTSSGGPSPSSTTTSRCFKKGKVRLS
jgi:hypothetical protein